MVSLARITFTAVLLLAVPAAARTLKVGPGQPYAQPSQAAAAAQDGDHVIIAAGQYFDCAVWHQNNLTVEGESETGTVITDKTCQGKALFVIPGNNVTVKNLTLTRARVADDNGAGIRAEGRNLTIDHVRFIDNQDGILTVDDPQSTLTVRDSEFTGNGTCDQYCAHAIYAGKLGLLRVERTKFRDTHRGHHIKSRALRTEIVDCDIADGPNGTASYLVDVPNGGALVVRNSILEKGPHAENHTAVITIGEEGVDRPTPEISIDSNRVNADGDYPTIFVVNLTATPAVLRGNTLHGKIKPLRGDGTVSNAAG